MTLKEKLEQQKAALVAAKAALENDEEGAAEKLTDCMEQVKATQAAIKAAEDGAALIKSLGGNDGGTHEPDAPARTFGEYAIKHLNMDAWYESKSIGTPYGYDHRSVKAYTDAQTSQQITDYSGVVDTRPRRLAVRSLFNADTITGNADTFFRLGAKEDNSAPSPKVVSENGAKPQFHIVEGVQTVALKTVAGWWYETEQLIEDNERLKNAIDQRGLYELDAAVEDTLITDLLGTSGIGTATYTHGGKAGPDDIYAAMMAILSATGLDPDAIIINPADYKYLRLLKTGANNASGEYYGGGFIYAPNDTTPPELRPGIWGLKTIVTPGITSGTLLIGNYFAGGKVITKRGSGARFRMFVGDHDDAIHNRVTCRVEERLALEVLQPSAFVKLSEAAS